MNILLHTCCAQCFTYTYKKLSKEHSVVGFFYNPNIHPFTEYKNRLLAFKEYAKIINANLVIKDDYCLEEFLRGQLNARDRCEFCYEKRLRETAKFCKENGFDCFTTTLLISPYQKHELVKNIAEEIAEEIGTKFYYEDFRLGFKESKEIYLPLNLYRQKYCGCIFSEKERFAKKLV